MGLASFVYLKTLPVDYLKISGVFVKDMLNDPINFAMVKAINDIGQLMVKRTIVDYVESDAVLVKLREIGVDFAQGHAVGRPQPLESL